MAWLQDGGHGGADPGAVSNGNVEKDYTLEASLYVDKRLAEHGIESDPSRTKDVSLPENERVSLAKKYDKGNSHHFNAGGGSGVEVIHSIHSDGKYEHILIDEFRKAGYPVRPRPVFFKTLKDGKQDYYYMHRRSGNCRMTIIEYDFVDGPQAEKIKDKAYREGMYECVVRAICRDEGVIYKSPGQKEDVKVTPKQEGVFWDDMQMKEGQIGRITIVKPINLWKRKDVCSVKDCEYCKTKQPGLEFERILNPGETYRVYGYDGYYNGQYNVGGGFYITNMEGYVKYETPSKSKLKELGEYYKK